MSLTRSGRVGAPRGVEPRARAGSPTVQVGREAGVDLRVQRAPFGEGAVLSACLDAPTARGRSEEYLVPLQGWVLGRTTAVTAVEIRSGGVVLHRVPVAVPRHDLAMEYPQVPWAADCGFEGRIEVFKLPPEFELEVAAVFADESRETIAEISGSWRPPVQMSEDRLQPIMLTTLGRSGSTWVTRLLGRHPRVVAYAPFRFEPRSASYWMEMYGALASPSSFHQILRGELYGPEWWAGARRSAEALPHDPIEEWLARQHVDTLLPLAVEQVEAFSRQAGSIEGKGDGLTHFVEKFGLNTFVQTMLLGLYPDAREIMLVRDPRDMVCSMLAYNRKVGSAGFGRDQVSTDADYVRWWCGGLSQMLVEWQARSDHSFLLRYEDLIREPLATLSRVFGYLGLENDPALLDRVLREASGLGPEAQKIHQTATDPAASIGRWEEDFTPEMKSAAAEAFPEILDHFGYAR